MVMPKPTSTRKMSVLEAIEAAALIGNQEAQRQLESFIAEDPSAPSVCIGLYASGEVADENIKHFIATMILALGRKGKLGQPGPLWNDILQQIHICYDKDTAPSHSSSSSSPSSPQSSSCMSSSAILLISALCAASVYAGGESMNELCQQSCELSNKAIKILLLTSLVEEYNKKTEMKDCSKLMENGVYYMWNIRQCLKESVISPPSLITPSSPPSTDLWLTSSCLHCLSQWVTTFNLDFMQVNGHKDPISSFDVTGSGDVNDHYLLLDSICIFISNCNTSQTVYLDENIKVFENAAQLLESLVEIGRYKGIPWDTLFIEKLTIGLTHSMNTVMTHLEQAYTLNGISGDHHHHHHQQQQQQQQNSTVEHFEFVLLAQCRCFLSILSSDINYIIYSSFVNQAVYTLLEASSKIASMSITTLSTSNDRSEEEDGDENVISPNLLRVSMICFDFMMKLLSHKLYKSYNSCDEYMLSSSLSNMMSTMMSQRGDERNGNNAQSNSLLLMPDYRDALMNSSTHLNTLSASGATSVRTSVRTAVDDWLTNGSLHFEILKILLKMKNPTLSHGHFIDLDEFMQFREQSMYEVATLCFNKLKSGYLELILFQLQSCHLSSQQQQVGSSGSRTIPQASVVLCENALFLVRVVSMEVSRWCLLANASEAVILQTAKKEQCTVDKIQHSVEKCDDLLMKIFIETLKGTRHDPTSSPVVVNMNNTCSYWQMNFSIIAQVVRMISLYARWLTQSGCLSQHKHSLLLLNSMMGYSLDAVKIKSNNSDNDENDSDDENDEIASQHQREGKVSVFASEAIRNLCSRAADKFASPEILNEILLAFETSMEAGVGGEECGTMVQGICRILSTLSPSLASQHVAALGNMLLHKITHNIEASGHQIQGQRLIMKKKARYQLKALAVMIRTTRATVCSEDVDSFLVSILQEEKGRSAEEVLSVTDRRTLELQVECSPIVNFLESSWPLLSSLLVPSPGNNDGSHNSVDKAWCIQVSECLMYMAVLPLRSGAGARLASITTELVIAFIDITPNTVLEYCKELCEVWGSRGDDEYLTTSCLIEGTNNEELQGSSHHHFGHVLQRIVSEVFDRICESYITTNMSTNENTTLCWNHHHDDQSSLKALKFDLGLFLNTCDFYLKRCPLLLLTAPSSSSSLAPAASGGGGHGNFPIIKFAAVCVHCIEYSLEFTSVTIAYQCMTNLMTLKTRVYFDQINKVGAEKAVAKWNQIEEIANMLKYSKLPRYISQLFKNIMVIDENTAPPCMLEVTSKTLLTLLTSEATKEDCKQLVLNESNHIKAFWDILLSSSSGKSQTNNANPTENDEHQLQREMMSFQISNFIIHFLTTFGDTDENNNSEQQAKFDALIELIWTTARGDMTNPLAIVNFT